VSFGEGVHALRGITFSLERGDSMAVVGETGSGKSTIALCLSGLIQPPEAKGSVRLDGNELLGAAPEAFTLPSVVHRGPGAPEHTVQPGLHSGRPERRAAARAPANEQLRGQPTGCRASRGVLVRHPYQPSCGQRRRAVLEPWCWRSIPRWLLDETTADLDPATRHDLVNRLADLAQKRGLRPGDDLS
jgi:ABC-type glutathione transport system ATPase component